MTSFLEQVVSHYWQKGRTETMCFIFPNRRSMSFFKKHFSSAVRHDSSIPVFSPQLITVNDMFYRMSESSKTDRTCLLLELYKCYKALDPEGDDLDEFIFWGDVILSDFDDIDKYLADAHSILANVADFKQIQDDGSYMTPEQKAALLRFLRHFRENEEKPFKKRFLKIWEILPKLYVSFRASLDLQGLSYEGQVFRRVAERIDDEPLSEILKDKFPEKEKFIFVGLNVLNNCEKKVLSRMRDAGMAEFCWDYSSDMIRNLDNKSSLFMRDNTVRFPQAFKPDPDGLCIPEINLLSVAGGIAQAKQLPEIFHRLGGQADIRTAIVLPDEGLLLPVLNSIPEEVRDINVTMGYPVGGSGIWSLLGDISSLQLHLRSKDSQTYFHHRQAMNVFSNSVFRSALDIDGRALVEKIRSNASYYIRQSEFEGHPLLSAIFVPAVKDLSAKDPDAIRAIGRYLLKLISTLAAYLKEVPDMSLELDFSRDIYRTIQKLMLYELDIRPATYFKLLARTVAGMSVPFEGEPLKGLQIMGPLETRALDFENVVILSCNEGTFPKRSVSSSFIPAELRKGFELPTYEFQDAVWAYYFYRLIQRAGKVWLVYDSRDSGLGGGEESRYIKQLEMHFKLPIRRFVAETEISMSPGSGHIVKTEAHVAALKQRNMSASALSTYSHCPAQFYYQYVEELKEDEDGEISESLDSRTMGNVFHKAMELLYKGRASITADYLDRLLSSSNETASKVAGLIMDELRTFEIKGRNIVLKDIVAGWVMQTLRRDRELLDAKRVREFRILGLEKKFSKEIEGFRFTGKVDRIDSFSPDEIRVVDYKTGKIEDVDINPIKAKDKLAKVYFQLYLYDRFIEDEPIAVGKKISNVVYSMTDIFISPVTPVTTSPEMSERTEANLKRILAEICDTGKPWELIADESHCANCKLKNICGQ